MKKVRDLEQQLSELRKEKERQVSALQEEKEQLQAENEHLTTEKQTMQREFTEELSSLKQEKQEALQETDQLQAVLDECTSTRIENKNEKQKFKTLWWQCQQSRSNCNATNTDTGSKSNNSSLQIPMQLVEFAEREHNIQLPKRSIEFTLWRNFPSTNQYVADGAIGTTVKTVERTAKADVDYSPIITFLVWGPDEMTKSVFICLNVVTSLNSTAIVYIHSRQTDTELQDATLSRQRRITRGFNPRLPS